MSAPVTIACTFDGVSRRKDRSIRLAFSSNLEVSTEDLAELDRRLQKSGWLLWAETELTSSDVPAEDAPSDTKKPSQVLRACLYRLWEQNTDKSEPFDYYYRRQMNAIIGKIKANNIKRA